MLKRVEDETFDLARLRGDPLSRYEQSFPKTIVSPRDSVT